EAKRRQVAGLAFFLRNEQKVALKRKKGIMVVARLFCPQPADFRPGLLPRRDDLLGQGFGRFGVAGRRAGATRLALFSPGRAGAGRQRQRHPHELPVPHGCSPRENHETTEWGWVRMPRARYQPPRRSSPAGEGYLGPSG